MAAYRFSRKAEEDLFEVWFYSCDQWGPDQADQYLSDLKGRTLRYAAGELEGRPAGRLVRNPTDFLYFRHSQHFVIYRIFEDILEVAAVIHCSSQEMLEDFFQNP